MVRKFVRVLALVALMVPALWSCGGGAGGSGNDSMDEAFSGYAEGYNIMVDVVQELVGKYSKVAIRDVGDLDGLNMSPMVNTEAELDKARDAVDAAVSRTPGEYRNLSDAARVMVAQSREMLAAYRDTEGYLQRKDYLSDKGEGLNALRERFKASLDTYTTGLEETDRMLTVLEDAITERDIAAHEKDKGYGYWFRRGNLTSRKVLAALATGEALEAAMKGNRDFSEELAVFMTAQGDKLNKPFGTWAGMHGNFLNTSIGLEKMLASDDDAAVDREHNKLIGYYNAMVDVTNSLFELESNGIIK